MANHSFKFILLKSMLLTALVFGGTAAATAQNTPPVVSPDKTQSAFLKTAKGKTISTGSGDAEANQLWVMDTKTHHAKLLVASKDNPDAKLVLAGLNNPVFSADGHRIYFLSAAWAVSDAVHAVDIRTGRGHFVCDGNSVDIIRSGRDRGNLIVFKHKYHPNGGGAYDAYWLVRPDGTEIRRLKSSKL